MFRLILARRPSSYSDSTGSTGAALVLRRRFGRGAGGALRLRDVGSGSRIDVVVGIEVRIDLVGLLVVGVGLVRDRLLLSSAERESGPRAPGSPPPGAARRRRQPRRTRGRPAPRRRRRLCGNQPTKSFLGDDVAALAPSGRRNHLPVNLISTQFGAVVRILIRVDFF